jgi:hypothetical protein
MSMLIEMTKLTKFEMTTITKLLINVMGLFFKIQNTYLFIYLFQSNYMDKLKTLSFWTHNSNAP